MSSCPGSWRRGNHTAAWRGGRPSLPLPPSLTPSHFPPALLCPPPCHFSVFFLHPLWSLGLPSPPSLWASGPPAAAPHPLGCAHTGSHVGGLPLRKSFTPEGRGGLPSACRTLSQGQDHGVTAISLDQPAPPQMPATRWGHHHSRPFLPCLDHGAGGSVVQQLARPPALGCNHRGATAHRGLFTFPRFLPTTPWDKGSSSYFPRGKQTQS